MGISIEFTRRFSMAHRLINADSPKCGIPHGHNMIVEVSLHPEKLGLPKSFYSDSRMVAEFGAVKARWHKFVDECLDHSFWINESDPLLSPMCSIEIDTKKLLLTPGDPTMELMGVLLLCKAERMIHGSGLVVEWIRLVETPTNAVKVTYDTLDTTFRMRTLVNSDEKAWWLSRDYRINGLAT